MKVLPAALVLTIAAALVSERSTPRATNPNATVVLELFTSQGCSSCPPADRLLSQLAGERFPRGHVIPLAYHVDYWNYLGWKDPFSSPDWSARQRAYARVLRTQAYTPQAVLNGTAQLVGSSEHHLRAEVERQLARGNAAQISIGRLAREGDSIVVDLHARVDPSAGRLRAHVVATLFENGVMTDVTRGENARRSLTNDAIVRWQGKAAEIGTDGEAAASIAIPLSPGWRTGHLGVAVFLQDPRTLAIHGGAARMFGAP